MRGRKTFDLVFKPTPEINERKKGRNESLVAERDRCLIARYYYYGTFTSRRYESIITQLEEEFFISYERILTIIRKNAALLEEFKESNISLAYLLERWPHFKW